MGCKQTGNTSIYSYRKSEELPDSWDTFLPAGHFLKKDKLKITEDIQLPDVSFMYVLITEKDMPVAAVYFQLLHLRPYHINKEKVKDWQYRAWKLVSNVTKRRMLVAGHLFRHDIDSYHYNTELSAFEAYQYYIKAIETALTETCAAAVLVKDMAPELVTYFQHYAPQYLLLRNDIAMEMEIPAEWQTMADYEKALKHKYAQRYRKVRNSLQGVEIKELTAGQVETEKENIFKLYTNVTEQQQVRLGLLNSNFIPQLKKHFDSDFKVWGMYEGDVMIGFLSAWLKEDAFDMFYVGFDYEKNATLQLYFNILFLSIENAIAFGKRKLILGRTALEAKARLGCKPNYLHTFLYIRNNFMRKRVLQIQQKNYIQEGSSWEERHPFKNA
ncbi:MAG: hypothetical protein EOP51_08220 [Sphingobacteriales bacterium]|nr:MAG: hypothetical protein EOP51_08220 [Sphingobacteriales bacterium]